MADPTQLGHIEFTSEQERAYFLEAVLGEDIRQFLNSTTGRYLHGRAKGDYESGLREMFELNPYTPEGKKKRDEILLKTKCAENFMKWCVEAIQNGDIAEAQLKDYED